MGFPVCHVCLVLVLLLAHCGVSAAITEVDILYSCGYENNCRGYSSAEAWCQNMAVPASRTGQLNITSAQISDSGVYHCCSVPECCDAAAQSENIFPDSILNVTVYGHAIVSPTSATCNNQDSCVVSYDTTQDRVTIFNNIGYHPSSTAEANRQGIKDGVWSVVNPAQVMNTIYRCRNFSCENPTTRNDIGTLTVTGEFGQNATIEDLVKLDSNLTLVYSIDTMSISSSRCTYTAQTAVTYTFEVTTPTPSPSPTPESPPTIGELGPSASVNDIGGIAGIAASIVVLLLIATFLLIATVAMCKYKGYLPIRGSQYSVESTTHESEQRTIVNGSNGIVYAPNECQPPTTGVTSTSSVSFDSGTKSGSGVHPNDDTDDSEWEDPYILSVRNDEPPEPPTNTAAKGDDTISLPGDLLDDFDKKIYAHV